MLTTKLVKINKQKSLDQCISLRRLAAIGKCSWEDELPEVVPVERFRPPFEVLPPLDGDPFPVPGVGAGTLFDVGVPGVGPGPLFDVGVPGVGPGPLLDVGGSTGAATGAGRLGG